MYCIKICILKELIAESDPHTTDVVSRRSDKRIIRHEHDDDSRGTLSLCAR